MPKNLPKLSQFLQNAPKYSKPLQNAPKHSKTPPKRSKVHFDCRRSVPVPVLAHGAGCLEWRLAHWTQRLGADAHFVDAGGER
jgi:hypothetical protein